MVEEACAEISKGDYEELPVHLLGFACGTVDKSSGCGWR